MRGQTSCCMVSCLMGVSPGCSLCSPPVAMLGDIMSLQNLPSGNWRVGNWTWPSRNSECSHSKCWILPVRHVNVYQRVDLHCPIVFQGFSLVSHCFPMVFPWFSQHSTLGMISYGMTTIHVIQLHVPFAKNKHVHGKPETIEVGTSFKHKSQMPPMVLLYVSTFTLKITQFCR